MNIQKKEKREKHGRRWHDMHQSHHGCAAWRGEERIRIETSGELEMHCDWCAVTGHWMVDMHTGEKSWQPREPCRHPGYYLECQLLDLTELASRQLICGQIKSGAS